MDSTIDHATLAELDKINTRLDIIEEKAGIEKPEPVVLDVTRDSSAAPTQAELLARIAALEEKNATEPTETADEEVKEVV